MRQSIMFLLLLLHSSSAEITTKFAIRNCEALKIRCDALPYRTMFINSNCYFVIDALADSEKTSKHCSLALPGANLASGAPDAVWSWLFADKSDFLLAGLASANKKKAMCNYEGMSPCPPGSSISRLPEGTCSARGKKKEEQKFWARIAVWPGQYTPVFVPLKEKLETGQEMIFKGISRPGINDFIINFHSTASSIQLQIWIVFSTKLVWLKSTLNGQAGTAEIKNHTLVIGEQFEIIIRARDDHFKICMDGRDVAEYKHRQPISTITQFEIHNNFGWLSSYQLGKQYKTFPLVTGATETFAICNQTNPKNKCMSMVVSGTVKPGYYRSVINLYRKNGDLAMHVNFCYDRNHAYITIQAGGTWAHGVNIYKPYPRPGEFMEVEFINGAAGFDIFVNGQEFFFYAHKIPSHDIVGVDISNLIEPLVTFREATKQKFRARMNLHAGVYSPIIVPLPEKLQPGQELTFRAIAITGSNEFVINLQSVGAKSIQLQILIYFSQKQVYLNSFFTHIAGKAEIVPHSLVIDREFEVKITAREDDFKISIDGKDFAVYKYRQPLSFITHFEVKGYGFLNSYQLGKQYKPYPSMTDDAENLPICKNSEPRNKCKSLVVTGTVSSEWNRAIINLFRKNGDIGFHLNFMYDKNFAYLDVLTNGRWWGGWTYVHNKPYPKPGERLEVEIVNGETAFQVSVGGEHFLNYTHLMPSFDIVGVEVSDIREPVITFK